MTDIDLAALQPMTKRMGWSVAQLSRLIDTNSEKSDKKARPKTMTVRVIPKPLLR